MIGLLLVFALIVAILWDEVANRRISKMRPKTLHWTGRCTCPNPDNHRPDCYAAMKWYEIGITVPQKYNYPDDKWKNPELEEWKD